MKFNVIDQIDVCCNEHQYSIMICRNGLYDVSFLQTIVTSPQVLIVTNQTVAPLYLASVQSAFASIQCDVVLLEDGEYYKNQANLCVIYETLITHKHHRDTTIIALGGGVIGDIAGFAASTYQRGVNFVQIPTTLLAQVDASVGGKTAINHPLGKNMIGSFYQPQAVVIDLMTLNSLPEREFRSGLAEMIKYALLNGGAFFQQLTEALKQGITANTSVLPELIASCCRIKAQFVEKDEKENHYRMLLNLGHTIAHALEAYTNYQQWLHGEAVAIGLYCAAILSYKKRCIEEYHVHQVKSMLLDAGLPHQIPSSINLKQLIQLMCLDKKIQNNRLRFVLIREPGDCYVEGEISEECLHNALLSAVSDE